MKYIIIMTSIVLFLIGEIKTEPKLLSFIAKGPSSKKEYLEYESKLKGYLNITYKKDTIEAEFYTIVNECQKTSGKIEIKNQTIKLSVVETGEGCKGIEIKRVKFIIKNPENKKFQFLRN